MDKEQLYKLVQDKASPTPSDVGRLRELAGQFPYFEVAQFIYLKSLYEYDIHSFKKELSRLGVLLSNREALFYYIFRDDYARYFKKTGKEKLEIDKTNHLLNAFFQDHEPEISFLEYEIASDNLATTDYLSYLEKESEEKEKEENFRFREKIKSDKLIYIEATLCREERENKQESEVGDTIDTSEEKQIQSGPIGEYILTEEIKEDELIPLKHQNIIDRFIESSEKGEFTLHVDKEKLKEDQDYPAEEEGKGEQELGKDTFFTETLAKIYIKQKRFDKAYKIIEHLSLKYPKKNSYFADQLEYLEKLIINSKYRNKK